MNRNGKIRQSASTPLPDWPLTFQLHPRLLALKSLVGAHLAEVFVQSALLPLRGLPKGERQAFVNVVTPQRFFFGQAPVVHTAQGGGVADPEHFQGRHFSSVRGDVAVKRDGLATRRRDVGTHRQSHGS